MRCPRCGFEEEEGSPFCSNCGAALGPPAGGEGEATRLGGEAQPPVSPPPPQAGAVPPVPPAPATPLEAYPPAAPGSGAGRNWTPVLIGIIGVLAVAVIVLVLVFTVFKSDDGGTGGGKSDTVTSDPAQAVEAFFQAIADGDVDSLIAAIDPAYIDEFKAEYGGDYKDLLEEFFLATNPEELEITGLEFEVEESGGEAVVRIVAGSATYLDADGEKVTEEVEDSVITDFETVKVDGRWYVSMSTFPDWWYYLNSATEDGGDTQGTELEYIDSMALYASIGYPAGWTAEEMPDGSIELWPIADESQVLVTLTSVDMQGQEEGLEQWVATQEEIYTSLGWEYEYSYTDFAIFPAAQFEYSYMGEGQMPFKVLEIHTEVLGRGYTLTYLAVGDSYAEYARDVQEIIGSLAVHSVDPI